MQQRFDALKLEAAIRDNPERLIEATDSSGARAKYYVTRHTQADGGNAILKVSLGGNGEALGVEEVSPKDASELTPIASQAAKGASSKIVPFKFAVTPDQNGEALVKALGGLQNLSPDLRPEAVLSVPDVSGAPDGLKVSLTLADDGKGVIWSNPTGQFEVEEVHQQVSAKFVRDVPVTLEMNGTKTTLVNGTPVPAGNEAPVTT